MRLILIRHAESHNNFVWDKLTTKYPVYEERPKNFYDLYNAQRNADPELSELGYKQAEAVGKEISKRLVTYEKPIELRSSPMNRTLLTTTAIEKQCGNDVFPTFQVYEGYFEQGGCFDNDSKGIPGRTGQEIRNAFPKAQPNWDLGKGWYEATYKDMPVEHRDLILPRVKRVVDDIWKNDVPRLKNGTLIVVVHGNFLDVMIKELLSSNNDLNFCAIHENTGISSFKLQHDAGKMKNKKRVYIEGINSYHHLLQDKLSKAVFLNEFSYEDCGMVDDAEGAT